MDQLTVFGLFAVTAMLICYALEHRSHWFILGFAADCALGSGYGFLQGAWPRSSVQRPGSSGPPLAALGTSPAADNRGGPCTSCVAITHLPTIWRAASASSAATHCAKGKRRWICGLKRPAAIQPSIRSTWTRAWTVCVARKWP